MYRVLKASVQPLKTSAAFSLPRLVLISSKVVDGIVKRSTKIAIKKASLKIRVKISQMFKNFIFLATLVTLVMKVNARKIDDIISKVLELCSLTYPC